jgi:hypothetical protein
LGLSNFKIKKNFITQTESIQILDWIDSLNHSGNGSNYHLSEIAKDLNGASYIFDISKTDLTKYITKFQSVSDVSFDDLPYFIHEIIDRISTEFNLPKENVFLQVLDMNGGGKIKPHYDASVYGYVNYKCNVSVLSEAYDFFLDKDIISIKEHDIYGFEASLYKHWTNPFKSRRVLLSFGFVLPYEAVSRKEDDPRVRLSNRLVKYFQNEIEKA